MLTFGSVCSGIEAASAAWEPLGMVPAWFSEIDPFPSSVLSQRHPNTRNLGDMTLIDPDDPAVNQIDALIGGTPCQGFSVAGLQGSLDDDRSNLALAFCRLGHRIAAHGRLRTIVWENVPGCLSTHDNAFGSILAGFVGEDTPLQAEPKPVDRHSGRYWRWNEKRGYYVHSWADAGCVYGPKAAAAWRTLDAQYFGLAQRRERVFVVVCLGHWTDPAEILFERQGVRRDSPPSREAWEGVAGTITNRANGGGGFGTDFECDGGLQVVGTLSADTHPGSYAGQDAYQNKLIPVAGTLGANHGNVKAEHAWTGQLIAFDTTQITSPGNVSNPQPGQPCHPLAKGAHAPAVAYQCHGSNVGPMGTLRGGNGNETGGVPFVAHALKAEGHDASEDGTGRGVPLVPAAYRTAGDGAVFQEGDRTAPLTTNTDRCANIVTTRWGVRRLLPIECERLQGFPDGHTDVIHRGKPAKDGPRYKAIGNSKAVPVVRWIGRRIVAASQ